MRVHGEDDSSVRARGLVGVIGLVANACFLVFEVYASFITGLSGPVMALAVCGGLLSIAWNILIAVRLFQLARA